MLRFRDDDEGDYGRTKRQQQVMSAVLDRSKIQPNSLQDLSTLEKKVFAMTSTNLPIASVDQWFICHRRRSEWYRKINCS